MTAQVRHNGIPDASEDTALTSPRARTCFTAFQKLPKMQCLQPGDVRKERNMWMQRGWERNESVYPADLTVYFRYSFSRPPTHKPTSPARCILAVLLAHILVWCGMLTDTDRNLGPCSAAPQRFGAAIEGRAPSRAPTQGGSGRSSRDLGQGGWVSRQAGKKK
jgi:hypothetical protein